MSHPLSRAGAASLLVALALAAAPSPAGAAADVPVAEVGSSAAIAVYRDTLAWIDDDGPETVVLRHPDGRTQRLSASDDTHELSLGRDRHGRLVLVFARCVRPRHCSLRRVDVRSGRAANVRGIHGAISHPVLRRGLLAWVSGGDVRTRRLAGGRIRRQTVGPDIAVSGLDHDGRRLVVTGETSPDCCTESKVDLRIVTLGSRRVRVLRSVTSSEQFHDMHSPLLGPRGVDVADAFAEATADRLVHVPFHGRRVVRSFGTDFTAIARGGGTLAYIDAPSPLGCGSFVDDFDLDFGLVPGGCRIVRAARGARILPPELVADTPVAEASGGYRVSGRLLQRKLGEHSTAVAGRQVAILVGEERDDKLRYPDSGPQVVTGADGRWSYSLPPDREVRYVGARTVDAPRAWVDEAVIVPAAP